MRLSCARGMPTPRSLTRTQTRVGRRRRDLDRDLHRVARILHGVVEQVREHRAQLVGVAVHEQTRGRGVATDERHRRRRAGDGAAARFRALRCASAAMSTGARCCSATRCPATPALQHLLDGLLQALGVLEHHAVELAPLRLADLARLQRLEIQADRRDRRLQLVGDGVDERVVLVVAAHLAHEEHRVDDDAGDDEREGEDAEHQRQHAPPVDEDPADVEGDRRGDEDDAEDDEDDGGGLRRVTGTVMSKGRDRRRREDPRRQARIGAGSRSSRPARARRP